MNSRIKIVPKINPPDKNNFQLFSYQYINLYILFQKS